MPEPPIAGEVARQLFLRSLGSVGTVTSAASGLASQLARVMRDARFEEGETMFAAGAPVSEVFFLARGEAEMRAPGLAPWRFAAPAVLGAIDALHGRPHQRDAVATTTVHALALRHEDWFDALEEHFDVARENLERIATDLVRLHRELAPAGGFGAAEPDTGPAVSGLNVVERMLLLREVPSFAVATVQTLARLADVAEEVELPAGRRFHEAGEPSTVVHVVASGLVEVEDPSSSLVARFGRARPVGGAAALGVPRRAFHAKAVAPSVLLALRREDLHDVMEDHFDLTRSLMIGLAAERESAMALRAAMTSPSA
ncbi:MAG TPA: cyclic nucleotide-binding domain-containing protein [Minicystis sp.]|nr:cyclic nucleotide-binding domain-containing protein [Minicystis sp.]